MLETLADPILPVFAILGIGFIAGGRHWFDGDFARTLNRFVFFVAQPALVFLIVARAPFAAFEWSALALYFASEAIVYALGFAVARYGFRREWEEALLLGMTCAFVNHVFYVLPIAELIYGPEAAVPIGGAIVIDVLVLFCGTILILDMRRAGAAAPGKVFRALSRNPALIAILAGFAVSATGPLVPPGIFTFAEFVGRAAPPASLFALGIVMAAAPLRPVGGATWSIVGIKVLVHPAIAFGLFAIAGTPAAWSDILILLAAGPCGAMPFVIGLQYGVKTETIARAILISTLLTLVTLAVLTT
ncbi:MAG: AEC family transporter [Rubricella sp.]